MKLNSTHKTIIAFAIGGVLAYAQNKYSKKNRGVVIGGPAQESEDREQVFGGGGGGGGLPIGEPIITTSTDDTGTITTVTETVIETRPAGPVMTTEPDLPVTTTPTVEAQPVGGGVVRISEPAPTGGSSSGGTSSSGETFGASSSGSSSGTSSGGSTFESTQETKSGFQGGSTYVEVGSDLTDLN